MENRKLQIGLAVAVAFVVLALGYAIAKIASNVPATAKKAATQQATLIAKQAALIASETADRRAEVVLQHSTLAACGRSNQLRAALNLQDSHVYAAFAAVARLESATANTAPSGKIVNQQAYHTRLRLEEHAAHAIPQAATNIQYLPLTDCEAAFTAGRAYTPPASISWGQHLKNERKADR